MGIYYQQPKVEVPVEAQVQDTSSSSVPSYEEVMAAEKITFQDVKDHLTGPAVSVIVHIVCLAILGSMVVFQGAEERKEIEVSMQEVKIKEIEKIPDPPPEERVEVEQDIQVERPNVSAEVSVNVGDVADVGVVTDGPVVQMTNVLLVAPSSSALVLPGLMAGRTAGGRGQMLKKYGGNSASERSLNKGLCWLRDHQNADGSWGDNPGHSPAMTALATLAFLGHGETPSSQEYGTCVLKAIKKLVEFGNSGKADGLIANPGNGYGHAMVAYALSEAFTITKIPMVEEAMNRTVARIVTGQNSLGSYTYNYKNDPEKESEGYPRCDLSVGGWQYQALKAAFAASCAVKGLETAIEAGKSVGLKKTHYVSGGGFCYKGTPTGGSGASETMTPVGTLCLQLFGEGKSKEALEGLKWIETAKGGKHMKCNWQEPAAHSLYQWYYQTQALFQGYSGTGGSWDAWNKEMQKALIKEQENDGHWSSPMEKYGPQGKGGGETNEKLKGIDLFVYSTSLCCLMLEVYYRYLPTFKISASDRGSHDGGTAEGTAALKKDLTGLVIE